MLHYDDCFECIFMSMQCDDEIDGCGHNDNCSRYSLPLAVSPLSLFLYALCSMVDVVFFGSSSCIFHHISISFFVSFSLRIFRPFLHIVCSCVRCVREYLYKWAKVAKMWREKANSCYKRMFGMEEKMILSWLKQ